MPVCTVSVESPVRDSFRVRQVIGMFDLPEKKAWGETFSAEIPALSEAWAVGCIVGPSGSGKSTLARAAFPQHFYEAAPWPRDRAVIDCLGTAPIQQITHTLTAVGLGSPPAWLKPFAVLSNGEKLRCELARALLLATSSAAKSPAEKLLVFDEFTSLVDRQVAMIASAAISRSLRQGRLGCRFVAVTCHADVVPWLEPDWMLDLGQADPQLSRVRLRRPELQLAVTQVPQKLWPLFARHHYLSGGLNAASSCFAAWLDASTGKASGTQRPVAFCALVPVLGKKGQKRISRIVTLPDYQGLGIGLRLAECVADFARAQGSRVGITASHPAVIAACRRSPRWRLRSFKPLGNLGRQRFEQRVIASSAGRGVASFEYLGASETEGPNDEA